MRNQHTGHRRAAAIARGVGEAYSLQGAADYVLSGEVAGGLRTNTYCWQTLVCRQPGVGNVGKRLFGHGKPQIVPRHKRVIEKGSQAWDWRVEAGACLRKCSFGLVKPQIIPRRGRVIERGSQAREWRVYHLHGCENVGVVLAIPK